jgi:hypothetical protein
MFEDPPQQKRALSGHSLNHGLWGFVGEIRQDSLLVFSPCPWARKISTGARQLISSSVR